MERTSFRIVLLFCLLLAFFAISEAAKLPSVSVNDFKHTNVKRTVNVKSHIEEQHVVAEFVNDGKAAADNYIVAIHPSKATHVSIVSASAEGAALGVDRVLVDGKESESLFFAVRLAQPIASGEKAKLNLKLVFTHTLVPFPAEIRQSENQLVKYSDDLYFYSPYPSDKQSTNVKLASSEIESYTKKSATSGGDSIEYGPFEHVAAFAFHDLSIHFQNNSPFVTFTSAVKEVEVSHWGSIAFEETIEITHTGANLKGHFSRFLYQNGGSASTVAPASYRFITATLPLGAADIYYRDRIGNVSTSHVREEQSSVHMEVLPRYPMFGGWKADFQIGYSVPADEFLFVSSDDSSHYVLNISFSTVFDQAAVDDQEVRIVLPEGASDIEWQTPFDIDEASFDSKLTYLDTTGRPVVVLKKRNVTKFHQQNFVVSYRFPKFQLIREPFLLIAAFFLFFVVSMAYVRFEFSIAPSSTLGSSSALLSRRAGKFGHLINEVLSAVQGRILSAVEAKQADEVNGEVESVKKTLQEIAADPELKPLADELSRSLLSVHAEGKKFAGKGADAEIKQRLATKIKLLEKVVQELADK